MVPLEVALRRCGVKSVSVFKTRPQCFESIRMPHGFCCFLAMFRYVERSQESGTFNPTLIYRKLGI